MEREGSGAVYEFTLPVGTVARITVECLNSRGEVIVRATKEHTVTGGDNVVSIILKNDGDEIINDGVTYSYGDAAAGGAVTGFPSSVKVGAGEKFTVTGDANSITWDHGTFMEWKTNVALKGDDGTADVDAGDSVPPGTYIMPSQNVTLTAQWQKNSYTITYNTNSPAGANVSSVANLPMTDALTQVTLATAPTVTNNPITVGNDQKNYTFMHWEDTDDGTTYSAGTQITLTKNMTLQAVWSDKAVYTVTYGIGSGGPATAQNMPSAPQSVEANDGGTAVVTLPALTATGYNFNGWQISGDSSGNKTGSYTLTGNVTATAQWSVIPYSITYNADGGNVNTSMGATEFDVTTGSINLPQADGKTGYRFDYWKTADGTEVTGMTGEQLAALVPSGSTTLALTAVWQSLYKELSAAEVGDVICANGKVLSADDITTELQSETIAVVYKVDANAKTAWAVGKVLGVSIKWVAASTVEGNSQRIENLLERNGYTDGSTGLGRLRDAVTDAEGDDLETNYPAWDYACNYGTKQKLSSFQTGWYLPSKQELQEVYNQKSNISSLINFTGTYYWSSTQNDGYDNGAYILNFTTSSWSDTYSKTGSCNACAVRQFTW